MLLCLLLSAGQAGAQRLRIAAANLTSGNAQSYDAGHGIRILQGLKADIVLIQEFNYGNKSAVAMREMVDTACGTEFNYFRESNTGSIPNGVISRYPILDSGQWVSPVAERDFSWARIDLPGPRELLAVSVHLPTTDSQRPNEASILVNYINSYYTTSNGARATDYLVVGGDFNSDLRNETALNTLGSVVTIGTSWPADRDGNVNTNAGRNKPYDAVYAGKGLHSLQTATLIGNSSFPNGLVADTRVYSPIAEIAPALTADSGSTNMQHHAIVRDFLIPIPADPPVLDILASAIKTSAPASVSITFQSTAGATYQMQATGVLTANSWQTLGSIIAPGTSTTITAVTTPSAAGQVQDAALSSSGRRFYRVIRP